MRMSKDAVEKEIRSLNTGDELVFVGTQAQANELAEKSLNKRCNDAAADYAKSGYPAWRGPRLDINSARAAAHEKLRKQNEENQRNQ